MFMEQKSPTQEFLATDITFHGREYRPTGTFEVAQANAERKNSKIIRVYGIPTFVVDLDTRLVYLGFRFSQDILQKIKNGTLLFPSGLPFIIDPETEQVINDRQKRRLKALTRVYRKSE